MTGDWCLCQLLFERANRLLEHLTVSSRTRTREIGAGTGERQFERPAARARLSLFWRDGRAVRFSTLGFGLLKLDVLALKASGHILQNSMLNRCPTSPPCDPASSTPST